MILVSVNAERVFQVVDQFLLFLELDFQLDFVLLQQFQVGFDVEDIVIYAGTEVDELVLVSGEIVPAEVSLEHQLLVGLLF